ncbi:MAG: TatD family deoxyribonuclease [Ruminococcaceae bacterium]|nr:TatD family deoxyribonuclease [Oscillospiraceae bacterium]
MSYNNIFDVHAHYDDEKFNEDREELLGSLPSMGVRAVVNASVDIATAKKAIEFSEKYPFMYAAVGIHPENLDGLEENYLSILADLYENNKKVVAIGEIGLDYYWDIPKEPQLKVFEDQLKLAMELDAPVVIHDREAHGDTMRILKKYTPKKVLLHCYSGSREMLKEVMRMGAFISLGGVVTFKNARVPVEVAEAVPVDRLLLETDCPYLSPVPFRGKRNSSEKIAYTAEKIAEIKGMDTQNLIDITCKNAFEFFDID